MKIKILCAALCAALLMTQATYVTFATPAEGGLDQFDTRTWDANGDGRQNEADLDAIWEHILGEKTLTGSNLSGADVYGDLSGDGKVDIRDYLMYKYHLNEVTRVGDEFMAGVTTEMYCPSDLDSDWVWDDPHHPTTNGTLTRITYYSTTCKKNRTARVYLPDCYEPSKKYPVLYILHGYWGHDNSMAEDEGCQNIVGKMIKAGECEEMIVVFPDIFASATKDYCDGMNDENNRAYDNCLNDITKDLMPYIESHYSVKTGRENTAVFGFSMGGREALAMGFVHGDKFGYVGASCPAPGVQDVVPESDMYFDKGYAPYLLMICAAGDDQVVWGTPASYHDIFTSHGLTHKWWVVDDSWHGGPANHSMTYNFAKYIFKATK